MPDILVIDDDEDLFALLAEYLKEEGFTCAHAADAKSGIQRAVEETFDAVVLDVMLPGMNGLDALRRLRADSRSSNLPILMLTARGEEIDRVVGLELGADDYLGKPFSPRELVARLRAVLRRSAPPASAQSAGLQHVDDMSINRAALTVTVRGHQQELSVPELRLLDHLVANVGQVVERDFLYKSIFGHQAYPMDRSLDMLVSRLRKKLGPRADNGERIKAVRGEGYMYLLGGDSHAL